MLNYLMRNSSSNMKREFQYYWCRIILACCVLRNIAMAHGTPLPPRTELQLFCKSHGAQTNVGPPDRAAVQSCHDLTQDISNDSKLKCLFFKMAIYIILLWNNCLFMLDMKLKPIMQLCTVSEAHLHFLEAHKTLQNMHLLFWGFFNVSMPVSAPSWHPGETAACGQRRWSGCGHADEIPGACFGKWTGSWELNATSSALHDQQGTGFCLHCYS